jgi:hypothetical protein
MAKRPTGKGTRTLPKTVANSAISSGKTETRTLTQVNADSVAIRTGRKMLPHPAPKFGK